MTRTPQVITAELRRWIVDQAEAGCRPQEIIAAMRTAGWEESLAAEAMEHTLRERLQELDRRTAESVPASAVPEPDLSAVPTVLQVAGHEVRVLLTLRHPRVVVLCVLDDPDRKLGHYGGSIAGPVVRDVVDRTLQYLGVPPDQDQSREAEIKSLAKAPYRH